MNRMERVYRIHRLVGSARRPVSMRKLQEETQSSRNTVTRDMAYMKDYLGAPLVYDSEQRGHRYDPAAPVFELPGLWMSSSELHALLACEQLLESVHPGLIADQLAPLKARIRRLLGEASNNADDLASKVRVHGTHIREIEPRIFLPVAEATLSARQLLIHYRGRARNSDDSRHVDPQRLVHYRNNWYLIAWCYTAAGLRQFSLDRIHTAEVLATAGRDIPGEELDKFAGSGFGIFSGESVDEAHLRFSDEAARWVAEERWHPDQRSERRDDGFHLWVPYSAPTELVMEILRYGPNVTVLAPESLRSMVRSRIDAMAKLY